MSVARALRFLPTAHRLAGLERHRQVRQKIVADLLTQIDAAANSPRPLVERFCAQARIQDEDLPYYHTEVAHEAIYNELATDKSPKTIRLAALRGKLNVAGGN